MFALGIEYLNGWVMAAADGAKKERAEWPPHPDRVFMALAAGWFETDQNPDEKAALQWLESLPAPAIAASDAFVRWDCKAETPVTSYVPVNDSSRKKKVPETHDLGKLRDAGLALVPEFRPRQPRRFPAAVPHRPDVHLIWDVEPSDEEREGLRRLCRKVVSIGHSASLVRMWLAGDPPEPTLVPVAGVARHRLRVFGPGRLDYLEARYNRAEVVRYRDTLAAEESMKTLIKEVDAARKAASKGVKGKTKKEIEAPFMEETAALKHSLSEQRTILAEFGDRVPNSLRPEPGLWQGYGPPPEPDVQEKPGSLFDPNLVIMNLAGKRLDIHGTLKLTAAVRGALLSSCPEPVPEWVSGHRPDRSPSPDSHLAMFPLPFVEHEHADGRIMGVAFALPREVDAGEAGQILGGWLRDSASGLPSPIRLFDGKWLECDMKLETRESPPFSLRSRPWTRPSRLWASVTPVVLDRHFDGKNKWEKAAEVVKTACERIGLPRPDTVLLHPVSLVRGVPHSREFPPIRRKSDGGRKHHCHAVIHFSEPVLGPVLVGAGRFRGYGLCRPMDGKEVRGDAMER